MQYTVDDRKQMQEAADCLSRAANLLYQIGREECVGIGEQIEPILGTLMLVLERTRPPVERNAP